MSTSLKTTVLLEQQPAAKTHEVSKRSLQVSVLKHI